MKNSIYDKTLRIALLSSAFGWGISAFGIFMPWKFIVAQLHDLGGDVSADPMMNYWFRMTACGFTYIAIQFAYLSVKPQNKLKQITIAAIFMISTGILSLSP